MAKIKINKMNRQRLIAAAALLCIFVFLCQACGRANEVKDSKIKQAGKMLITDDMRNLEKATFGAGCFWCVEAVFQRVKGVVSVVSGYEGGTTENPTYEMVCSGATGHAEVCEITFDSTVVSYQELLEIFWKTHDPTTLNRQGNDAGTQYRSVIFYHSERQKELAAYFKAELTKQNVFENPIVTQIVPASKFYRAEEYHQNYYNENPRQGYCAFVITPKVEKFRKIFKDKVKDIH